MVSSPSAAAAQYAVSSELRNKLSNFVMLLGPLDAISRWRRFALLVMAFVACGVISAAYLGITDCACDSALPAKARVSANANAPTNSASVQDMPQVSPSQANCLACTVDFGETDMLCSSCDHKLK